MESRSLCTEAFKTLVADIGLSLRRNPTRQDMVDTFFFLWSIPAFGDWVQRNPERYEAVVECVSQALGAISAGHNCLEALNECIQRVNRHRREPLGLPSSHATPRELAKAYMLVMADPALWLHEDMESIHAQMFGCLLPGVHTPSVTRPRNAAVLPPLIGRAPTPACIVAYNHFLHSIHGMDPIGPTTTLTQLVRTFCRLMDHPFMDQFDTGTRDTIHRHLMSFIDGDGIRSEIYSRCSWLASRYLDGQRVADDHRTWILRTVQKNLRDVLLLPAAVNALRVATTVVDNLLQLAPGHDQ